MGWAALVVDRVLYPEDGGGYGGVWGSSCWLGDLDVNILGVDLGDNVLLE